MLALAFCATPAFLVYENWYFYPHLCHALLLAAAYGLLRSRGTPGRWMAAAFYALAALVLLRSLFHPLYFVAIVAVVIAHSRTHWRGILRIATVPLLVILGLCAKNQVLFGFFGTSSWGGNSLHHVIAASLDWSTIREMEREGKVSPISLEWEFSRPQLYLEILGDDNGDRGIPALDTPGKTKRSVNPVNYNHWVYPVVSKIYFDDAITLVRAHPAAYLESVAFTFRRFFDPVTDEYFLKPNTERIPWLIAWSARIESGNLSRLAFGASLLYAAGVLARRRAAGAERLVLAFALCTILWVGLLGVLFEYGENNRFRYEITGLAWILFVVLGRDGVRLIRAPGPRYRPSLPAKQRDSPILPKSTDGR
jgi:hypothetical protein